MDMQNCTKQEKNLTQVKIGFGELERFETIKYDIIRYENYLENRTI